MTDNNKRKQERFSANLFAELSSASGVAYGRAVVIDVSLSGVGVESEIDLTMGEELECHIEMPLQFRAKVVRRVMNGQVKHYGLLFTDQSFFDKLILKKILKGKRQSRKVSL
jgi:hypothetical protein